MVLCFTYTFQLQFVNSFYEYGKWSEMIITYLSTTLTDSLLSPPLPSVPSGELGGLLQLTRIF